jgi:23S rRNA G2445 N2-methylase RlmL
MNYLKQAVDSLRIYTTPKKVQHYVNKHKFDFLIQNPPYDIRKRNKMDKSL